MIFQNLTKSIDQIKKFILKRLIFASEQQNAPKATHTNNKSICVARQSSDMALRRKTGTFDTMYDPHKFIKQKCNLVAKCVEIIISAIV